MTWKVLIKKPAEKSAEKLGKRFQSAFLLLLRDLIQNGPTRSSWPNYGKLKGKKRDLRHCHLIKRSKPTYVVCWEIKQGIQNGDQYIEIYYVGTHENAPY